MEVSDLINIGKLRHDRQRKPYIVIKKEYQHLLPKLRNTFLIFKDHRVRYVSVEILNTLGENKAYISINDSDVAKEASVEEFTFVSIDEDEINQLDDETTYYDPIGMKVSWNSKEVGEIIHFFNNGAHYVYEIQLYDYDKQVVLIPDVDDFVIETNTEERFISVRDLDKFIYL
jgi:ribosomal 30S subunit maturation factor RimM